MNRLLHAAQMLFLGTRKARILTRARRPNARWGNRVIGCVICSQYPEAYMVHNTLWEQAGLDKKEMCCMECLGRLLDRPIEITDLTDAPINAGYARFFMAGHSTALAPPTEENPNGNR